MKESWVSPAIGIDLGTGFSSVAVWQHGQVEIIVNDQGSRKTPFCVAFTESEILIGEAAKNQSSTNPANTIFGVSPEGSFLAPCSKMTRTVKSWVQESSPSLIVKDIDSLLEDLNGSKNFRKSSTSFCSLKIRLLKLLEEVRRKPNDVQLTLQVSQSLTSLYPYLPNHLLTVIKSIEEDLLASQQQYLEWSSKEAAISLNVEETGTIQSHLVKFNTDILEMTSSRDYLRSKITGIDKEIATLMDHKSQIEEKLSSVEKDLHKLIHSIDLQVDLARRQSAILAQRREASNFKDKAQLSIEATLNSFASYFKNM